MDEIKGRGWSVFHVALVVDDVPATMTGFSATLGTRWGRLQRRAGVFTTPAGKTIDYISTYVISLDGPFHWELIGRHAEGLPWSQVGFHHVAIWCDNAEAEGHRLTADGWTWERGKYWLDPSGARYELVPRSEFEPRLARYTAGGDY